MFLPSIETSSAPTLLHSASYSCAIKAIFVKILICHSPNDLRAVTANLQRLVGVLAADAEEEERMSCKGVAPTWVGGSDMSEADSARWYPGVS